MAENTTDSRATLFVVGRRTTPDCDLSFSIVFCSSVNANTSWWVHEGSRQRSRADNTDQGERRGGVHAVLYPPTIIVLKRGEGGGRGFGIKDGIKQAGRRGKVLARQRLIVGFDPSRPSQPFVRSARLSERRANGPEIRAFRPFHVVSALPILARR